MSKYNKCQLDIVEEEKSNFVEEEKIDLPEELNSSAEEMSSLAVVLEKLAGRFKI